MRGLNVHLLMLMVSMIWGFWAIGRLLSLSLPPATGAWMRYIVLHDCFYMWFGYRSASGQDVRWLPGSRDSTGACSRHCDFAVMGYQLFMHGMKFTAAGDASLSHLLPRPENWKMIYGSFIGVVVVTGWSPKHRHTAR